MLGNGKSDGKDYNGESNEQEAANQMGTRALWWVM